MRSWSNIKERVLKAEKREEVSVDERISEIKGAIFSLITIFFLVSFTSYLPLDTFSLLQGRFDYVSNLGGIVGAVISEIFLGGIGAAGFVVIVISGYMAFECFNRRTIRSNLPRILGMLLASVFVAIMLHLFFSNSVPEKSLLQGGILGIYIGKFLETLFSFFGAVLILVFGFIVTFMLAFNLSINNFFKSLLGNKKDEKNEADQKEESFKKLEKIELIEPPKKRKRKTKEPEIIENLDTGSVNKEKLIEIGEESSEDFKFSEPIPFTESYSDISLRLLKKHENNAKRQSRGEIREASLKLVEHLKSFQIFGTIDNVTQGPVVTTYEFKPDAGIKLSKISGLQDDLGVILGTRELRIVAPIPGKTVVGIEVPRKFPEFISLRELISQKDFWDKKLKLPVPLGKKTDGTILFDDLATMPHLLVAGATGSGKSVFINTLITGFLYRLNPKELRLILIDPKMLELVIYDGIPHLLAPVVTRSEYATVAFKWAVEEMERRYDLMSESGSKNIDSYNEKQKSEKDKFPYIVIIVDELADLMFSSDREDIEVSITRLAQKARAAGIHLVIATQRPSTDVVTGLIKANIPSRISFKVPSAIDSRTILDSSGAQELIGRGDGLMIRPASIIKRIHCPFISEEELNKVVKSVTNGKNYSKYYIEFGTPISTTS